MLIPMLQAKISQLSNKSLENQCLFTKSNEFEYIEMSKTVRKLFDQNSEKAKRIPDFERCLTIDVNVDLLNSLSQLDWQNLQFYRKFDG